MNSKHITFLLTLIFSLLTFMVLLGVLFFLGLFYIEYYKTDGLGNILVVGIRTHSKPPYQSFECQNNSLHFLLECGAGKVEPAGDLIGE